jgi:hypothetical protein
MIRLMLNDKPCAGISAAEHRMITRELDRGTEPLELCAYLIAKLREARQARQRK